MSHLGAGATRPHGRSGTCGLCADAQLRIARNGSVPTLLFSSTMQPCTGRNQFNFALHEGLPFEVREGVEHEAL